MSTNITITVGVTTLIANAKKKIPEGAYTFKGDMCQMATALSVAEDLGLSAGTAGGYSYVYNKEDFDKVVEYLKDNQINGFWLY